MKRFAALLTWALLTASGAGCASIIREAMTKDSWQNTEYAKGSRPNAGDPDEQSAEVCPPGKLEREDCRTLPCKVTCEDPEGTKR